MSMAFSGDNIGSIEDPAPRPRDIKFGKHGDQNYAIYLTDKNTVRIDFTGLGKRVDYSFEYLVDLALYQLDKAH